MEWVKNPEDDRCREKLEQAIRKTSFLKEAEPAILHAKGLTGDQRLRLLRAMDNADIIAKSEQAYVQMSFVCGCYVWEANEEGKEVQEICAATTFSSIWAQKEYDYVRMEGRGEYKC